MHRPALDSFSAVPSQGLTLNIKAIDTINRRRRCSTVIALVAMSKGGSGKSTLTMNMAIGYGWERKRVLIVDADIKQRTTDKWPRPETSSNPTIIACPSNRILATLSQIIADYDVVLIDLPGQDDPAVAAILEIADILVSPVKPSPQDLSELDRFIRVARVKGVPHLVAFNEATREQSGELELLRRQFSQYAPFLPIAMQQLVSYRRVYAHGRGVLDIAGPDPAKENFERVFAGIAEAVAAAHEQRAA